jgi:hypothetical protein
MKLYDLINESNSASELWEDILKNEYSWQKPFYSEIKELNKEELIISRKKIEQLIQSENEKKCKLLIRGESISNLKYKLNDRYLSKVFSVGEKARNYLSDMKIERDSFEKINDVSQETMDWIFDQFARIHWGRRNIQDFFHTPKNKIFFIEKLSNNEKFRDYYLYGLHTEDSSRKVFFVSSSSSPDKALYNESNKILILFWIPEPHIDFAQSKITLKQVSKEIETAGLPLLSDSFFPKENEYSIKGAIFPDFIYSVIDVDNEKIIISSELLNLKSDWILNGFDIHLDNFKKDYNKSNYKNYVERYSTKQYVDK